MTAMRFIGICPAAMAARLDLSLNPFTVSLINREIRGVIFLFLLFF